MPSHQAHSPLSCAQNFYTPEDTVFGRKPYHGSKELLKGYPMVYLSWFVQNVECNLLTGVMMFREYAERQLLAEDVQAKVAIEDFSIYHEREVFPEGVYYWRQEHYVPPSQGEVLLSLPLSLKKRTKEGREKDGHARNAGLVDKHTKLVEKLVDRKRRSEARRQAEDRKRQREEEERRAKEVKYAQQRAAIEIDDDDSDHEGDRTDQAVWRATKQEPTLPEEPAAEDSKTGADAASDEQARLEIERECEAIMETTPRVEVDEEEIELAEQEDVQDVPTTADEPTPPPSSSANMASSNRMPSPTPSPQEILQTPPNAASPARKRLRRNGPTLSSLSALSASASSSSSTSTAPYPSTAPLSSTVATTSSLSSLSAARRGAQQRSLASLWQRGQGKNEPIEVGSDDDDTTATLLSSSVLPPVTSVLSSQSLSTKQRALDKRETEHETAAPQERGSRWKMYTQESPEDAVQNQYVSFFRLVACAVWSSGGVILTATHVCEQIYSQP
jgi:hypothetical protein